GALAAVAAVLPGRLPERVPRAGSGPASRLGNRRAAAGGGRDRLRPGLRPRAGGQRRVRAPGAGLDAWVGGGARLGAQLAHSVVRATAAALPAAGGSGDR